MGEKFSELDRIFLPDVDPTGSIPLLQGGDNARVVVAGAFSAKTYELWVDAETVADSDDQNGGNAAPYATLTQAFVEVGTGTPGTAWVIHVLPGDYTDETPELADGYQVIIRGHGNGPSGVLLPAFEFEATTGTSWLTVRDCKFDEDQEWVCDASLILKIHNCFGGDIEFTGAGTVHATITSDAPAFGSGVDFYLTAQLHGESTPTWGLISLPLGAGSILFARGVEIADLISCHANLESCTLGNITLTSPGDGPSLATVNCGFYTGSTVTLQDDALDPSGAWLLDGTTHYNAYYWSGVAFANGWDQGWLVILTRTAQEQDEVDEPLFGGGLVQLAQALANNNTVDFDDTDADYDSMDLVSQTANVAVGQALFNGTFKRGLYMLLVHLRVKTAGTTGNIAVTVSYKPRDGGATVTFTTPALAITATTSEIREVYAIALAAGTVDFFWTVGGVVTPGALSYDVNVTALRVASLPAG